MELQDNDSSLKASRTHFRGVAGPINALPAAQKERLQSEGILFGDLPTGLQHAILSVFNHVSPDMTVDLTEALIRAEPKGPDDNTAHTLMTTAPLNLRVA
jgi:hypothetical protein